LVVLNK